MKIFIVTEGSYSYYHICAVFTDRRQAELYCAAHNYGIDIPEIEEWDTDEVKLEECEIREKWRGVFDWYGNIISCYSNGPTIEAFMQCKFQPYRAQFHVTACLPKDFSREQAEKSMCDFFAKWKYEQEVDNG